MAAEHDATDALPDRPGLGPDADPVWAVDFGGRAASWSTAEDVAAVLARIADAPGRDVPCLLRLAGNTLGIEAAEALAGALHAAGLDVRRADLSDLFTGRLKDEIAPALQALVRALSAMPCLEELSLSDNAFGPVGAKAIAGLLEEAAASRLRSLYLNNNGLGTSGGAMVAEALELSARAAVRTGANGAASACTLEVFVAGRNRLENAGAKALAKAFASLRSLRVLRLPQNGIHALGIRALAEALAANERIEEIDLNDNTFTEAGAEAIAQILPQLQALRRIDFGDCLMRSKGAVAIARALSQGHELLEELDLSFNEIGDRAAVAIADALRNKRHLKRVNLSGNQFGSQGNAAIQAVVNELGLKDVLELNSDEENDDESTDEGEDDGSDEDDGAPAHENAEAPSEGRCSDALAPRSGAAHGARADHDAAVDALAEQLKQEHVTE